MLHLGLDDAQDSRAQNKNTPGTGVLEFPFFEDDVRPRPELQLMLSEETRRYVRFIETCRLLVGLHVRRDLAHVAEDAIEFRAEFVLPTALGGDPGSLLPGWVVTHVLRVRAFELCEPNVVRVLMKADDLSLHG